MRRSLPLVFVLALGVLGASALIAQRAADPVSSRHPAIAYATRETTDDPVARLNARLLKGEETLGFDEGRGYLRSVLDALHIPIESQMLVYSETSLQFEHITRATPRAIYFSDTAAVGWVRGSDTIEVAAVDPQQGTIFYQLSQTREGPPRFARSEGCLTCHALDLTRGVPGMLTMSMLPMSDDPNEYANGWAVDQSTPIQDRWGGWFVTSVAAPVRHLGNVPVYHVEKSGVRAEVAPTLTSVETAIDASPYLTPYSDIVALLVVNHQTTMANLLTRLNWTARIETSERTSGRLTPPMAAWIEEDPVASAAAALVDYMLFINERPLRRPVRGNSGFAEAFMARGPKDSKGRSLRDLDLSKRLLKYPCSYMIYSPAFDGLPAEAKTAVYDRMWTVLSGRATGPAYRRLSAEDRRAIIEILRDTKPDLPAVFR